MKQNDVAVRTLEKEEANVLDSLLPQWLVSSDWLWIFTSILVPKSIKFLKCVNDLLYQLFISNPKYKICYRGLARGRFI